MLVGCKFLLCRTVEIGQIFMFGMAFGIQYLDSVVTFLYHIEQATVTTKMMESSQLTLRARK